LGEDELEDELEDEVEDEEVEEVEDARPGTDLGAPRRQNYADLQAFSR
jgi:hypothetical protein